jgi:hypothetical protein
VTDHEELFGRFVGKWRGQSTLFLDPESAGDTQPSWLEVTSVARGNFLRVDYFWTVDEQVEEGVLLIGFDPRRPRYEAAWIDSWHMSRAMMFGTGESGDTFDISGTYMVPGYPDWGWRIRLEADGDELRLMMWNVSPEGEEARAVSGTYQREAAST